MGVGIIGRHHRRPSVRRSSSPHSASERQGWQRSRGVAATPAAVICSGRGEQRTQRGPWGDLSGCASPFCTAHALRVPFSGTYVRILASKQLWLCGSELGRVLSDPTLFEVPQRNDRGWRRVAGGACAGCQNQSRATYTVVRREALLLRSGSRFCHAATAAAAATSSLLLMADAEFVSVVQAVIVGIVL
ncbi:uncharacterized protein BKA78DRAFT_154269 [Phyllosticta capitalensis]|uniref:uncharacterized protein n=1 Tax=Phyllosticta capitalensis TaxID=121624 RepID=UPI0031301B9D